MEVPWWETEAAVDQAKKSSQASTSRSHSCGENTLQIDKEKRAEEKNPPPLSPEKGEEEEVGRLLDEDETAEDFMCSFRDGWESCFADLCGSFENNS